MYVCVSVDVCMIYIYIYIYIMHTSTYIYMYVLATGYMQHAVAFKSSFVPVKICISMAKSVIRKRKHYWWHVLHVAWHIFC